MASRRLRCGLGRCVCRFGIETGRYSLEATLIYRKGAIFAGMGLQERAEKVYKEALIVDSQFSWPHRGLGVLYEEQEKFELAKQQFEKALKINPEHQVAKVGLERVIKKLEELIG